MVNKKKVETFIKSNLREELGQTVRNEMERRAEKTFIELNM